MKSIKYLGAIISLVAIVVGFAFVTTNGTSIEIGSTVPKADVKMKDVSKEMISLNDMKKENGLLVIFSCNTCPFVVGTSNKEGWEKRYNGIYSAATEKNIGMVLINSNEAFRGDEDSFDQMVEHARKMAYKSNYVVDKDHVLADAFGAKTTPHVFLFDNAMKLVYKGAIDDNNASSSAVKEHYLKDAIAKLSEGNQIDPASTKALGCSIKRVKS